MKEFVVPNDLIAAKEPERSILNEAEACGYCENATFAIKLALEEAITNAFRHGNKCDPSKCIIVRYEVSRERIEIEIADQGAGFEPNRVPDPTQPEFIDRPHGRGIMLMRAYLDEVQFDNNGSSVRLTILNKKWQESPNP